ncbi:lipopolysaccharide kinase InaA family protein [Parendozoicomonas haliclonae]|uniref:Lipopolysaccharide core heptose(I) kinase RfaP n=1 Tax=Parendozoicomonas haliclonae TaxID=1960125 RepID=A0A1X7AHY8_9GAMM|nr:lipopolysaccharide kinase InaA family protein [Parendozoicomonas haliclonae]SMA43848.1 hypothetical protein EHSB41UT_01685 [Parendozoicomonas haliclonae]
MSLLFPDISTFFDNQIESALKAHQLDSFDALWNSEENWIEEPNKRRNGWSGVSRLELPDSSAPRLFMKRQENHNTRTAIHPIHGVPTYRRELNSIQLFKKHNIPTLTPVYYGERIKDGNHQAILITLALDDYQDMFALQATGDKQKILAAKKKLAEEVWQMHRQGLAHYCLYPNHVFVRFENNEPEIILIDLEKVRRDPLKKRMRFKDLECYLRHSIDFTQDERQHFIDSYMAAGPVRSERELRRRLQKRIRAQLHPV